MSEIKKLSDAAFVELSADEEAAVAGGWYRPTSNVSIFFGGSKSGHFNGGDFKSYSGGSGSVNFFNKGGVTGDSYRTSHSSGASIYGFSY